MKITKGDITIEFKVEELILDQSIELGLISDLFDIVEYGCEPDDTPVEVGIGCQVHVDTSGEVLNTEGEQEPETGTVTIHFQSPWTKELSEKLQGQFGDYVSDEKEWKITTSVEGYFCKVEYLPMVLDENHLLKMAQALDCEFLVKYENRKEALWVYRVVNTSDGWKVLENLGYTEIDFDQKLYVSNPLEAMLKDRCLNYSQEYKKIWVVNHYLTNEELVDIYNITQIEFTFRRKECDVVDGEIEGYTIGMVSKTGVVIEESK